MMRQEALAVPAERKLHLRQLERRFERQRLKDKDLKEHIKRLRRAWEYAA